VEVRVGPYAIIEAGCVIGDYCEIRAHAVICKGTLMGPHNQIGYGAIIGAEPQDYGYKGGPFLGGDRLGE
jgi:UDP-N-acetylglucosamine acyltransferase